ncbi:glycosyltransferase [Trinickia caryophylli]|uniref:Glycosyltransferase, GT2 family n=1 Tax=Trinickia caryophylli TaxID=28094 RepID=A0A1X7EB73_TRICW|nr:glycosyltransferase [Trinickia caryophylli]PMS12951.1 glycosyltransferase family 2 protein [Trinickia caryophylli]TRX14713.1 glycosyltransferase family 2 protein [Trinickia caryophylli]WQE14556.1 glycosyltransferase [Trinickia caryophylli]SMF30865.1 Glycosyltransferase, GT2 family [Trinickia caryophylli]GLU32034.1 transferase [Trinickia caryophylli]
MSARISVVVLTHNRVDEATRTVAHLLALPERPPIIVADNGSTDGTVVALRRRFPEIDVVECDGNLGAAGRNVAAGRAHTEYIAFSDDDTQWAPGSLEEAVRVLDAAPDVAVLSGKVLVGDAGQLDPTCVLMSESPLSRAGLPGPALVGFMAGACVFRASAFRAMGGYEPHLFIGGEEELLSLDLLDAGHAIVYCGTIAVTHRPSSTRDAPLRRLMLARNAAIVAWLRLPASEAIVRTWRALAVFVRERRLAARAWPFLRDIGWALKRRRAVGAPVLAMRRRVLDAQRGAGAALAFQPREGGGR